MENQNENTELTNLPLVEKFARMQEEMVQMLEKYGISHLGSNGEEAALIFGSLCVAERDGQSGHNLMAVNRGRGEEFKEFIVKLLTSEPQYDQVREAVL